MPCHDSFRSKPKKVRQALEDVAMLLRRACVVGLNDVHPNHQDTFDGHVSKVVENSACYGSVSGNMLFWCLP